MCCRSRPCAATVRPGPEERGMIMGTEEDLRRIAWLASTAAERVAQGHATALAPLLDEMRALGEVLPGLPRQPLSENLALDAEIEAGFDNMPV